MRVTPESVTLHGENPLPQAVRVAGLSATQGWTATPTEGILANPNSGVNNGICNVSVPSLPVGSAGKVVFTAPGSAAVEVEVKHVA